jgi:hypothetical protein
MSVFRKYVGYLKQKCSILNVSVRGLSVYCVGGDGFGGCAEASSWFDSVIDAFIVSGLTFFSALGGDAVSGLSALLSLKAAIMAACIQFFIFLSIKRGIRQIVNKQKTPMTNT